MHLLVLLSPNRNEGGSVAEWLACWTQAQNAWVQIAARTLSGTVLGKLFTPIMPLFTKQRNGIGVTQYQYRSYPRDLLRVAGVTAGLAETNGSLPPGL